MTEDERLIINAAIALSKVVCLIRGMQEDHSHVASLRRLAYDGNAAVLADIVLRKAKELGFEIDDLTKEG